MGAKNVSDLSILTHAGSEDISKIAYKWKPEDNSEFAFDAAVTPFQSSNTDVVRAWSLPSEVAGFTHQGLKLVGRASRWQPHRVSARHGPGFVPYVAMEG